MTLITCTASYSQSKHLATLATHQQTQGCNSNAVALTPSSVHASSLFSTEVMVWLLMLIKQEPLIAGGDFVGGYKTHQLIILETVNRSIFLRIQEVATYKQFI